MATLSRDHPQLLKFITYIVSFIKHIIITKSLVCLGFFLVYLFSICFPETLSSQLLFPLSWWSYVREINRYSINICKMNKQMIEPVIYFFLVMPLL